MLHVKIEIITRLYKLERFIITEIFRNINSFLSLVALTTNNIIILKLHYAVLFCFKSAIDFVNPNW